MIKTIVSSVKWMRKAAGGYLVWKIVLMVMAALLAPCSMLVMQKMIQSMEWFPENPTFWKHTLFWGSIFVLLKFLEIAQNHWKVLLELFLKRKLKECLLSAVAEKGKCIPYKCFEDAKTRDILHRLEQEPHELVWNIFDETLNVLSSLIAVLGILVVFAQASGWFAVIFIVVLLPALWCDYQSSKTVSTMHHEQTPVERELSYYEDLLFDKYAMYELKMMNSVEYIQDEWEKRSEHVLSNYMGATRRSQLFLGANTQLFFCFAAFVLGITIHGLLAGTVSFATFAVLINAIQTVDSISYDLGWSVTSLSRKLGKMEYLDQFFDLPEEARAEGTLPGNAFEITFDRVSFSYPGTERQVLQELSFSIRPGEKVCIVGRNGAGKSTIIKLLAGLYRPDEGGIRINGKDLYALSCRQMKQVRSVVFQDFVRYSSTIRENVAYGRLELLQEDGKLWEALKHGMADFAGHLERGLDTALGTLHEEGLDLSGGEWQKLAIARGCLCESSCMILDEPTAALDPMAESRMYHTFSEILKESGYIFVSHRLASAKMADRILVLDEGRILEDGSHEELIKQQGLYARMFLEQSNWYRQEEERMAEA